MIAVITACDEYVCALPLPLPHLSECARTRMGMKETHYYCKFSTSFYTHPLALNISFSHTPPPLTTTLWPPPRRKAGKSGGKKAEGNLQVKFRIQTKAWNCSRAFPNGGLVQPRWLAGIGKSLGVILGTLAKALARTSFYTTRGFINVLSSWHACLLPTSGNLRPWSRASLAFLK